MTHVQTQPKTDEMDAEDRLWRDLMLREWASLSPAMKLFCWLDYLDDVDAGQPRVNDHHCLLQPLHERLIGRGDTGIMRSETAMTSLLASVGMDG